MSDLQVSLAFLLENEAEVARAIEEAGGKAGRDFGDKLSGEAKKAFDQLISQAEQAAAKVGARFSKQDLRFRDAEGKIISPDALKQLDQLDSGFAEARQAVEKFRSALSTSSREGTASLNLLEAAVSGLAFSLANTLTNAAGSALGSVKGLVGGFLELDGELRLAAAAAGEEGGYQRLAGIVNKVGVEAAGTTKQVAELGTSLVRAGFSVSEIERALPGVVRGAEATGTSFESFGNIVGNTLRGFGLDVSETSRVVDVLVNTANSSNASIEGLGYTFEYTAPIAKALGVSLEDVAFSAGLMANAGIQGSVAGTGMRTSLQKLQQAAGGASPEVLGLARGQERLQKVMAQLGATVTDSSGKLLPLEQVYLRLKAGLEKLNQADQVQLANILFGDEAGSKMLAITNQTTTAISKLSGDIRNSAGATDTARKEMQGMGMDFKRLEGTVDSLKNQLGGLVAAGLKPLLDLANAAADAVSGLPSPVTNTVGALIALTGAATAASIGMGALNLAVLQLGGWAALKTAITGAAAIITGPLGAGVLVVLGLAAAAGVLAGSFKGANEQTQTLVKTTAALGAMAGTMTLIALATGTATGAMTLFGQATKAAAGAMTFLQGVSGKGWIGLLAGLAAGAATYAAVGKAMEGTADKSEALTEKQRSLKEEIGKVQERISKQKALNIDTSISEERLDRLQAELAKVERPLEIKLDIKKAETAIKELEESLKKVSGKPEYTDVKISLKSAKQYKQFLESMDSGVAMTGFSDPVKRGAEEMRALQKEIDRLGESKLQLPLEAKADREQIDREIERNQQYLESKQGIIKLRIDEAEIRKALSLQERIYASGITPGGPSAARDRIDALFIRLQENLAQQRRGEEQINQVAEKRVDLAKQALERQLAQLNAAKSQAELQQMALGVAQQQEQAEARRLQLMQGAASAMLSLANAQAGRVQSTFDLDRSRSSFALSSEERRLQYMQSQGASSDDILNAERNIAIIKREQENIEFRAMKAGIEATTQRLILEDRILAIKQAIQEKEAQSAVNQARTDALAGEIKLRELQIKAADPGTTPEQAAVFQQQIDLQAQSNQLLVDRVMMMQSEAQQRGLLYGLERATVQAQKESTANQTRGAAAAKGWEQALRGPLQALDEYAFRAGRASEATSKLSYMPGSTTRLQPVLSEINALPSATNTAETAAQSLALAYRHAKQEASQLLSVVEALGRVPNARWAGGPAVPGDKYQVNELGTESFLSASGNLSLITAPAYGTWSPPTRGTVLPAGVTARLQESGALPGGSGRSVVGLRGAPGAPGAPGGTVATDGLALVKLQGSIDRLQATIAAYDPSLQVHLPGNAGLLATLQAFR